MAMAKPHDCTLVNTQQAFTNVTVGWSSHPTGTHFACRDVVRGVKLHIQGEKDIGNVLHLKRLYLVTTQAKFQFQADSAALWASTKPL